MKCLSIICLIIVIIRNAISASNENEMLDYRLNTDIEPIQYDIELTPYFSGKNAFTFDGYVQIILRSRKPYISTIVLHKEELNIIDQSIAAKSSDLHSNSILQTTYDERTSKYFIKLTQPLIQNELYVLNFNYTGKLRSDMHGFYLSSYREGNVTK